MDYEVVIIILGFVLFYMGYKKVIKILGSVELYKYFGGDDDLDDLSDDLDEDNVDGEKLYSFFDNDEDEKTDKSKRLSDDVEAEMDALGLEEWQKDLVREGRYLPTSFSSNHDRDSSESTDSNYYKDDTW